MEQQEQKRVTPYNRAYPTCERTYCYLRIDCGHLTPGAVSESIGVSPTESEEIGRVTTNSIGRRRTASRNLWILSTEGSVNSLDLRHHLDALLQTLKPRKDELLSLQDKEKVQMSVNCIWYSVGHGGPVLWPEQMAGLAELNVECGFDIFFLDEADD